ncbi:MAG: class I SAM-dependent methyltransferase [Actinomycetota bacterium]|nr:class I SAM-dependent methyltransferase [Actinomycetota bacterium]
MIDGHQGGLAIDIACGTGRYAERLVDRGYQVVGVDGVAAHAGGGPRPE